MWLARPLLINLVCGCLMWQIFARAIELLDEMTKFHRVWYIRNDMVTHLTVGLIKKQIEKN